MPVSVPTQVRLRPTSLLLAALTLGACSLGPARWDGHDAHRNCKPTLRADDPDGFPDCAAMHMCANEAVLSQAEQRKLESWMEERRCAPP